MRILTLFLQFKQLYKALSLSLVNKSQLFEAETLEKIIITCERIENVKDRAFLIANNYALTPHSVGPVSRRRKEA